MLKIKSKYINFKRRVVSLIRSIRYRDTWKDIRPNVSTLIIAHENHYTYTYRDKYYSPLFGSMLYHMNEENFTVLLMPLSSMSQKECVDIVYRYNRTYICNYLFSKFFILSPNLSRLIMVKMWSKILRHINPRQIITILPKSEMCIAARKLDIDVIEIQHGVINDSHPAYGWDYVKNKNPMEFPNEIWVWNRESANVFGNASLYKKVIIKEIGHPWLQRFKEINKEDILVIDAISNLPPIDKDKYTILVTLQPNQEKRFGSDDFDGVLLDVVKKVIFSTDQKYNWLIRLHPGQLHGFMHENLCKKLNNIFYKNLNIEWERTSEVSLPALLHITDLHLTISSSVVIEAAMIGVKSGLLDPEIISGGQFSRYYLKEREEGMAVTLEHNAEAIKTWLKLELKDK